MRRPVSSSPQWPFIHEYSPEARNIIWLPAAHYDEKLDFQHDEAKLRDLLAATGLVILLKLDWNAFIYGPYDLEIISMN